MTFLLPNFVFGALTIRQGGTGTSTFQSGWIPMGLNSLRLTEIASTTWGFINKNNTWTGNNTFSFNSQFGTNNQYWKFEDYDLSALGYGHYPLLTPVSDGTLGNIGFINYGLYIKNKPSVTGSSPSLTLIEEDTYTLGAIYFDGILKTTKGLTVGGDIFTATDIGSSGIITGTTLTDSYSTFHLGNATTTGDLVVGGITTSRIKPRVTTITSSATPTFNTDNTDTVTITALATAITSMTSGLSGTPNNFDKLLIRIKDNGATTTIAWGTSYAQQGIPLPTVTVASKVLTIGLMWDAVASKWECIGVTQEY